MPHAAGQEVPEEGVQQRDAGHDHKGEARHAPGGLKDGDDEPGTP